MAKPRSQQSRCRQCGKPLPPRAREDQDPYCSTVCCKAAYHVVDRVPKLPITVGAQFHRNVPAA